MNQARRTSHRIYFCLWAVGCLTLTALGIYRRLSWLKLLPLLIVATLFCYVVVKVVEGFVDGDGM